MPSLRSRPWPRAGAGLLVTALAAGATAQKPTPPATPAPLAAPPAAPAPSPEPPSDPDPAKLARIRPRTPEQSMAEIELPPGYHVELVASEPMVEEPALIEWDGNGRMYVAELLTYMQDIDGTDELTPKSRIVRLEDTDGDGKMDRRTVFADGLLLPRMMLALQDGLIVRETNTLDLWWFRDSDGDGVADSKKKVFEGGPRGGNLEHQPSGLVWNLDNRCYVTYTAQRYRWEGDHMVAEPLPDGHGQWGVTHDDEGQVFFSVAGAEVPATGFQQNPEYGDLHLPGEMAPGFEEVFPALAMPDVQGGPGRLRPDGTLNHFTACGGQTIYRGDRLPATVRGDLFIPEPVGRLVRRAKVTVENGVRVLRNAHPGGEFLRSTDPNFRPVQAATGPDGTLYLVDMYRGIIQEGNWVDRGSYLRGVVQQWGFDRNIGRGRIYRIVHDDFGRGPTPQLLDATGKELVRDLAHPNGWWRDTAQKLLVVRQDHSVVDDLLAMVADHSSPLAQLHALWTLDGLHALDTRTLLKVLADPDPRLRRAAVRLCEPHLVGDPPDRDLLAAVQDAADDADAGVALQVVRTAILTRPPHYLPMLDQIARRNPRDLAIQTTVKNHHADLKQERMAAEQAAARTREEAELAASIARGEANFRSLCIQCHGEDGRGARPMGPATIALAPPLAGSPRALGAPERLLRIMLQGVNGPIDGLSYPGPMVPLQTYDDGWLADVATYVRHTWGNDAPRITPQQVAAVRAATRDRATPWTLAELEPFDPVLRGRQRWHLSASVNDADVGKAVDGDLTTRWSTNSDQQPGQWLRVELPRAVWIDTVALLTGSSTNDHPRGYELRLSTDGSTFGEPVLSGEARGGDLWLRFSPHYAKAIEVRQTGHAQGWWWSVHELYVYGEDWPAPGNDADAR